MPSKHLKTALASVDWNANVKVFLENEETTEKVEKANLRIAVWAKQLESADEGNPALSFVREMQTAGHLVAACLSLALYKAAAGSIRSLLENALYYTFFRSHKNELITLARNPKYFVDKNDILEFHKVHTIDFAATQQSLSLVQDLEVWYSHISSIVHGQLPGKWNSQINLADIAHDTKIMAAAVQLFSEGETLVHRLFLCTVSRELWDFFSQTGKAKLIAGLDGKHKDLLKIDSQ